MLELSVPPSVAKFICVKPLFGVKEDTLENPELLVNVKTGVTFPSFLPVMVNVPECAVKLLVEQNK